MVVVSGNELVVRGSRVAAGGSEAGHLYRPPPSPTTRGKALPTVQFTCSDCAQTIEVNDEMRETILATGCPVCTTADSEGDFGDE